MQWRDGLPASGGPTTEALIRVLTDDGSEGLCHLSGWGSVAAAIVPERIAPFAVGRDALAREALFTDIWQLDRMEEFPIYLLGVLDVALWDLAARRAGLPLNRMLGSAREAITAYASTETYGSVEEYLEVADQCVELGYVAIKLHAWGDVRRDAELVRRLRDHVGPGVVLLYDGSAAFDAGTALNLGRALEAAGFGWYEEPMREFALGPYRSLAAALDIPVLGAETSDGGHYTAAEWLASGACDMVRTSWWFKGGVTGALRIAHLADAFGTSAEVHGGGALSAHLCCAISNTTYYEAMVSGNPVVTDQLVGSDGRVRAPGQAGAWGEELDASPREGGWRLAGQAT